jgi:flagellar motor switch protein FliM
MTASSSDPLSSARVRQLLAAVGSAHHQEPATDAVTEYDWRDPHYFNADQLNRLAAVMSQTAARLAQAFAHFHSGEFDVSPTSVTQHFANDLPNLLAAEHDYFLTFGAEKGRPCGFAVLSAETARVWVALLLGETESGKDPERGLSPLEESLLSDLAAAVLESFLLPLRAQQNLKADNPLGKGQPNIQYELTEEICRIAFRIKKAGSEDASEVAFLLPCSRLAALVGKSTTTAARVPPQELARTLTEHLYQMPVTLTARLAATNLRFRDALELGQGDILLLNQALDQPAELLVEGHLIFRGRPARSNGRYALLLTQLQAGSDTEMAAPKTASELKKG